MKAFSFNQHPIIRILESSHELLPGLGKLVTVFFNPLNDTLNALSKTKNNPAIQEIDISSNLFNINTFRDNKSGFPIWLSHDEMPFGIHQKNRENADLFSELEHVILLLKYCSDFDKKNDLLFFYFKKNNSNFGVSDNSRSLNTENKAIIGFLLHNLIKGIIENHKRDKNVLDLVNSHTQALMRNAAVLKDELIQTKCNYGQSLVNLCEAYLRELNINESIYFYFSDAALDKIRTYQGDINHLKTIIDQSVTYAYVLETNTTDTKRILHEWHINFEAYVAEKENEEIRSFSEEREIKTIQLLNKLENAAQKVIAKRVKLTSSNVGKECPHPISAPAITDALSKHRIKIQELIKKYPDKWPLLKSEFRPLKNIMYSKNDLLSDTA